MELLVSFKNSILLPKREALFRLNRISMRNTLVYVMLLSFLLFSIDIFNTLTTSSQSLSGVPAGMYVLQLIAVYPFFIVFIVIAGLSLLAAVSTVIKLLLKRKLTYSYLWKMNAFCLTIPLLLYTVMEFLPVTNNWIMLSPLLYHFFLIYKVIIIYPKKKSHAG